jgi:hypothetical protein
MAVVASGRTIEADSWTLDVRTSAETGELFTMVDVRLADGRAIWGGGCGGPAVRPGTRINTYAGAGDIGPRTFIARVTPDGRAVVITLSDGCARTSWCTAMWMPPEPELPSSSTRAISTSTESTWSD